MNGIIIASFILMPTYSALKGDIKSLLISLRIVIGVCFNKRAPE